jgi:hypothetical protein
VVSCPLDLVDAIVKPPERAPVVDALIAALVLYPRPVRPLAAPVGRERIAAVIVAGRGGLAGTLSRSCQSTEADSFLR